MNDVAPILLPLAEPPRRDRRILATAALSVLVHLLVLGWILLPRAPTTQAEEPQSIAVELVPPSEVSSVEPSVSSQPPPSSQEPPSTEASSSAPSAAPSAPSSAEDPSSAAAPSTEPASSAEVPSSVQPSAASSTPPPPSESSALPPSGASSAEPSSAEEASSAAEAASASSAASAPQVPPARPVVIPVGQGASSEQSASADNASASASEAASAISSAEPPSAPDAASEQVLAASGAEASEGVDPGASSGVSSEEVAALADGPPPPAEDLLHAAKRFYLADMLDQAALAKARAALKKLPPEKRLAQTCNIEAVGQIGNAGKGFAPDAVVANAFAAPAINGTDYTVSNGAFRSKEKWYGIAYECSLNKDMTAVTAFKFHIGAEVTEAMVARYGKG